MKKVLGNSSKRTCLQKVWKLAYRVEGIAKTRVPRIQKEAQKGAKSVENMDTGGERRIGKYAFRMEGIAKTKVSSRKKAQLIVEIDLHFFKKQ